MNHKNVAFEVKSASGDGSTGTGLANAFHNIDSYKEIVAPGAFSADIDRFLAEGFIGGLNHNWDQPIGRPTKAVEGASGLEVAWQISDTAHGRDVKTLLKDGVIKKLSIGYKVLGDEYLSTSDDVAAYWASKGYTPSSQDIARAADGGVRLLTRIELYEFSPVTVPANDLATITGIKGFAMAIDSEREFEQFLRDAGYSKTLASAIASKGFKAALARRDADAETPHDNTLLEPVSLDPALLEAYFERESRLTNLGI